MTSLADHMELAASGAGSIRFLPSGEEWTFARLWSAAETAGHWLQRNTSADTVACLLSSTPSSIATLGGAFRAGFTVASLPHPSRGSSFEDYVNRLEHMVQTSGSGVVLADADLVPLLGAIPHTVFSFESVVSSSARPGGPGRGNTRLIQFTSGSTQSPKGVELSLDAVLESVVSTINARSPDPGQRYCSWLPLSHDAGLIGSLLGAWVGSSTELLGEAHLNLIAPEHFLASPISWLRTISDDRCAGTAAPTFALRLLAKIGRTKTGSLDLRSLREVIVGAEPVSLDALTDFADMYRGAGFDPRAFKPCYGLAEATAVVSIVRPGETYATASVDADALADGHLLRAAPQSSRAVAYVASGRPIDAVGVRIADPEGGELGSGELGSIEITGPTLLSSYVGTPTEPTFTVDPDGTRWLRTGDLGWMNSDGELFVSGREDDLIIVGGRNFLASDVEAALVDVAQLRPGCAVAAAHNSRLCVIAELRDASSPGDVVAMNVRRAVTQRLGIAPAAVLLVAPGQVPKTPSGKLQRRRAARWLDDPTDAVLYRFGVGSS